MNIKAFFERCETIDGPRTEGRKKDSADADRGGGFWKSSAPHSHAAGDNAERSRRHDRDEPHLHRRDGARTEGPEPQRHHRPRSCTERRRRRAAVRLHPKTSRTGSAGSSRRRRPPANDAHRRALSEASGVGQLLAASAYAAPDWVARARRPRRNMEGCDASIGERKNKGLTATGFFSIGARCGAR